MHVPDHELVLLGLWLGFHWHCMCLHGCQLAAFSWLQVVVVMVVCLRHGGLACIVNVHVTSFATHDMVALFRTIFRDQTCFRKSTNPRQDMRYISAPSFCNATERSCIAMANAHHCTSQCARSPAPRRRSSTVTKACSCKKRCLVAPPGSGKRSSMSTARSAIPAWNSLPGPLPGQHLKHRQLRHTKPSN